MNNASSYLALTKPRLLPLILFSGLPALVLGAGGWPTPALIFATLIDRKSTRLNSSHT